MAKNGETKKYMRLQTRFAVSFALLAVLLLLVSIGGFYYYARTFLRDSLRTQLQDIVGLAVLQIDAELHSTIRNSQSHTYGYMQGVLREIRDATVDVRYIYTLREDESGNLYFVVDGEENPADRAAYGEIYYDAGPVLAENFTTLGTPVVETAFYTDRWGTWLSGYAPIELLNGEREAILGMDIAADQVLAREQQLLQTLLLVFSVLVPVAAFWGWVLGRRLAEPLMTLTQGSREIAAGNLDHRVQVGGFFEAVQLADAFNLMTGQLSELVQHLERRVQRRTHDLERRAHYLEATGQVSRVAASILDVETLLRDVAALISERFGFYHAGIFLLDESATWAVLRAVSSEGGKQMLGRQHRLRLGEGIVGYVAREGKPRVAFDVGEDLVWVKNPDLPLTRSEMALPLIAHGRVIGVLDVQSVEPEAFSGEDITTLRVLADQLAVAIENARLFGESQRVLRELKAAQGLELLHGWAERLEHAAGYRYTLSGVVPVEAEHLPGLQEDETQVLERNVLIVPLKVAGTQIGALRLRRDLEHPWTGREINFVQRAVQDVTQALENVRLLENTRERATRELVLSQIGARMRETLDMDAVLQTALREMGEALSLAEVQVRMGSDPHAAGIEREE